MPRPRPTLNRLQPLPLSGCDDLLGNVGVGKCEGYDLGILFLGLTSARLEQRMAQICDVDTQFGSLHTSIQAPLEAPGPKTGTCRIALKHMKGNVGPGLDKELEALEYAALVSLLLGMNRRGRMPDHFSGKVCLPVPDTEASA